MTILVVGLNHESASLSIREQLHFDEEGRKDLEIKLNSNIAIKECVVLSTCNRTEIYAITDSAHLAETMIRKQLLKNVTKDNHIAERSIYLKLDDEAVTHLFTVVCGLDSLVVGETQILGQVKQAFFESQKNGFTKTVLNRLFQQAITLGKRAHTQTSIGEQAVSVSYAAIQLLKREVGSLREKRALIIGAGTMSRLAAQYLKVEECSRLFFVNRTFERATDLAAAFNGEAYQLNNWMQLIEQVDIVICSVEKNDYLVQASDLIGPLKTRKDRPLFLIDLGVPRNIDPATANFENVSLYDLDRLHGVIESNLQQRLEESNKIKQMIKEEIAEFKLWKETLVVTPLIRELQERSVEIHEEAMKHIENKLPDLTGREKQVIRKFSKMICSQLTMQPIAAMKEMTSEVTEEMEKNEYLHVFSRMFGLENTNIREQKTCAVFPSKLLKEMYKETGS